MSPTATSQAMLDLCRDPHLRHRLGARSSELARGWDMNSHVRAYEDLFAEVVSEAAR
jgi:hypothetical protein